MPLGEILIYIAGLLWGIELIPQLVKTYKRKSVDDISTAFFTMCCVAYILYTVGNILTKDYHIVIAHIPSVILTITMVGMIIKYRKKK